MDHQLVSPAEFCNACTKFPTGVTVTTVLGRDGKPYGVTVNSFTSVSLTPPLILVCIDRKSSLLEHLAPGENFGINVLGEHQKDLSVRFSRRWSGRFADLPWYAGSTGVPLLFDVSAVFECKVLEQIPAGDHFIFLGEVVRVMSNGSLPLTYVHRSYRTIRSAADL